MFNFWHPPVMAWMLGGADRIIPGAPLFMVMDAALFFAGLTGLALVRGAGWPAVAVTGLLCASPLVLIYQGLVVKDVLFADASLAGFAALAWAARPWRRPAARFGFSAAALVLLAVAGLARQNGVIVAIAGALTLAFVALARQARPRRRAPSFAIALAAGLALLGMVGAVANAEFTAHSDHQPETAREWMTLQLYDLAGATRRDPALALPILHRRAPGLERFVRRAAAPAFDPTRIDTILHLSGWREITKTPSPAVAAQWRQLIVGAPALYLALRSELFGQVFLTPQVQACAPVLVGVDPGDPALLRQSGLAARDTDKDDWDGDYASAFLGTPVFSHLAYALLAVVLLVMAARDVASGKAELIATFGLLTAALAFTASYFVISIACDYRYLYFLDVAAMAALVQRLAMWRRTEKPA